MKTFYTVIRIVVGIVIIVVMFIASIFWLGDGELWQSSINEKPVIFFLGRFLFAFIPGYIIYLISLLLYLLIGQKAQIRKNFLMDTFAIIVIALLLNIWRFFIL